MSRSEFENFRLDDLRHFLALIIKYLAIPVMAFGMTMDWVQFGFQWTALAFRFSFVAMAFGFLLYLRKPRTEGALFFLTMLLLFVNIARYVEKVIGVSAVFDDYKMTYWQGLLCFVLLPLRPWQMATGILSTMVAAHLAVLHAQGWSTSHFKTYFFIDTVIATFFYWLAYIGVRSLRERYYEAKISLQSEVDSRDAVVARQSRELAETNVSAAIGRAAQMLAHDVRGPLARVKCLVDAVRATAAQDEKVRLVEESAPDIERSLAAVSAMVADVMDLSAKREPARKAEEPADLYEMALRNVLQERRLAEVPPLRLEFGHAHRLDVDGPKIVRVFENILRNALDASGELISFSVRTEETRAGFMTVVLGNGGSFVPVADRERLFDLFFTSGKRDGTGLGLAIVKQAVEAHGGEVWCESGRSGGRPEGWVEFHMTLPTHASRSTRKDLGTAFVSSWAPPPAASPAPRLPVAPSSPGQDAPASAVAPSRPRPLVAFLDDSVTFRVAWKSVLGKDADVEVFDHPDRFWERQAADPTFIERLDSIVTDYHFEFEDDGNPAGLAFARKLREEGYCGHLFLATNDGAARHEGLFDGILDKRPLRWKELVAQSGPDS